MEPPVRTECRRNWDAIQPHILALLLTLSWELIALSSSQCVQLFQRHHYLPGMGGTIVNATNEVLVLGASHFEGKTVNKMT